MATDAEISTIVRSTIDLGHNLGLQVVAEGVEDLAVWNMLRSLGCDDAQGYFMSRPLEPRALASWIRANAGKFDLARRRTRSAAEARRRPATLSPRSTSSKTAPTRTGAKLRRCSGLGPSALQRRDVRGRGISLVPGEREARIAMVEIAHQRVARGLGEDRRRADRRHRGVALDHRLEQAFETRGRPRRDSDCRR